MRNLFFSVIILLMLPMVASAQTASVEDARHAARAYWQAHDWQILDEFSELLALPNYGGNDADIRRNAAHITAMMFEVGIEMQIIETGGAPALYGELKTPGATKTVVIYLHYDGQPIDPSLWVTPAFEPTVRDGALLDGAEVVDLDDRARAVGQDWRIYARSASDDKAPIIAIISALHAMKAAGLSPSVNLKFFFEGEEEMGSPFLEQTIINNTDLLASDFWLFLDGPQDQRGNPRVVLGVRGTYGVQMTVYGPISGLHSGHYGNFSPNPISRLAHIMASMRDEDGRILIDGFYDDVMEPSEATLALINDMPLADDDIMAALQIADHEHQRMRYEQALLWPALNFRGIQAGGVFAQSRNVIVPEATVSIGFRLVPNQTLEAVRNLVETHLRSLGYHILYDEPDRETRLKHSKIVRLLWSSAGYEAVRTVPDNPWAAALIEVMRQATDGDVLIYPTLGGSLPLAHITKNLNVPLAVLPIANQDNSQHAPNENIRLGHLFRGIELYAAIFAGLGEAFAD